MRMSDWSSDVCSSDLHLEDEAGHGLIVGPHRRRLGGLRLRSRRMGGERGEQVDDAEFLERRAEIDRRQIAVAVRSEEHTSELQSLMRISYAVFCLKKKTHITNEIKKQYE